MKLTFNTACPRNCYSTCSFKVIVEDNKVKQVEAQPLNRATSEGLCLKGISYIERANSNKRILHPLKKVNSEFVPVSWDDALNIISEKLIEYKRKWGSHSVLYYAASGMSGLLNSVSNDFWKLYGGVTTVYGNLCWPAGLEATRLTFGEVKHNAPWDLENAKLIILWGKNPAESNIHQMVPIEKAQQKGAKLIVIDPRRTASSERADILLQPIPGTDGLLALSIAKLIIDNDKHDKEFISKFVFGFSEFRESLNNIDVNKTSITCGIPVNLIEKLASLIGNERPMTIIPGYGMQRYTNGGQTTRCLMALSVITGNIGKKGACWHYANLQSYIFDKVKEPLSYYPDKESDMPFRRAIPTARLGEEMLRINNPALKMAWVERGNPITQNPDSNITIKAFKNLGFVVVVEQFMTDTAQEADIILPAKSMFEQSDIIGSYWNPYVQLKQKVVDPPGEVKPETEIYYLLAKKLGIPAETLVRYIPEPNDEAIDKWLNSYLDNYEGLTLEDLKDGPVLAPGYEEIAFSDMMFPTPSGRIELYSEIAEKNWSVNPLPSYDLVKEGHSAKDDKHPLCLLSPNTKNRIHSQFGNLECVKMLEPKPVVTMNPKNAYDRGIAEFDRVRVYNDRGEITIGVKFDYSLRPGNVVIFNGYWNSEGGNPNLLSKGRETDMGHGTAFHDNMVEVEKTVQT